MLKRIRCEIKNYCETVMVLDQAATNANIKECENDWQAEINNCKDQINKYNDLKNEIAQKDAEAQALQTEMANNSSVMATANITHPDAVKDVDSCSTCLDDLRASYSEMSASCDQEIADWTAKQNEAQQNKDGCKSDASLEVWRAEEHCYPDE